MTLDSERAASFAAVQALMFANLPVCSSARAADGLARRFAGCADVWTEARALLVSEIDVGDPISMETFQIHTAIALLEAAQQVLA